MHGGAGADNINGGRGEDNICGDDAVDQAAAEYEPDIRCFSQVEGSSDVINVVDGQADTVDCGLGDTDIVRVDSHDEFDNCELVVQG